MEEQFIKDTSIKQSYSNILYVELTATNKSKISADFSNEKALVEAIDIFDKHKNKLLSIKEELERKLDVGKKNTSNSNAFFAGRASK